MHPMFDEVKDIENHAKKTKIKRHNVINEAKTHTLLSFWLKHSNAEPPAILCFSA